jgi:regulator of replication initiation timing
MGDTTFPARFTTAKNMLNTTTTDIFQQYIALQQSSSSLTSQNNTLTAELTELKAKLAGIQKQNETYDREFLDRSAGKKNSGVFRRNGITTLQDWILFLFFIGYFLICIIVLVYYVRNSPFNGYYLLMGIAICTIFGIMMSAVIIRFI